MTNKSDPAETIKRHTYIYRLIAADVTNCKKVLFYKRKRHGHDSSYIIL